MASTNCSKRAKIEKDSSQKRIRKKIIELYGMIIRLEKAKKHLKNTINNFVIISKVCETINVLYGGINHWRAFYKTLE